jgi:hypothetical protein
MEINNKSLKINPNRSSKSSLPSRTRQELSKDTKEKKKKKEGELTISMLVSYKKKKEHEC